MTNIKTKIAELEREIERFKKYIQDPAVELNLIRLAAKLQILKETQEEIKKVIGDLNQRFRKDNIYYSISEDEFNDLWETELKEKLGI